MSTEKHETELHSYESMLRRDEDVPDYGSMLRLDGQVFVVLGAGLGIGRQTSHALASMGATVVCVDREAERAEKVSADVGGIPWNGDVTDRESVRSLFGFVGSDLGRLDGVVDIIGVSLSKEVLEFTDDDWMFEHTVVLKHAYLALKYAAEYWRKTGTGGSLTFVASITGLTSSPRSAAYGAFKAALMSLVRTAAVELGPDGIRVNAVAPGAVLTPRLKVRKNWTSDVLESNVRSTPLRRLANPSDVASAILFLVSRMAGHVTGHSLVVDGGVSVAYNVNQG
jgi:NAD(P)-dependent dehydrogenase (short-subunit alcohol dehydrogenase family)